MGEYSLVQIFLPGPFLQKRERKFSTPLWQPERLPFLAAFARSPSPARSHQNSFLFWLPPLGALRQPEAANPRTLPSRLPRFKNFSFRLPPPAVTVRLRICLVAAILRSFPRRTNPSSLPPFRTEAFCTAKLLCRDPSVREPTRSACSPTGKEEEHIVSSLNLTWPQVHCVPQWPIRGSRLVFMSYRDCSNQIQKFAVRFSTCANAETFVCYFKACSRDKMDFAHPANYFLCDSSSASEMIASNALQHKFNDGESYEEAITRDMPSPVFSQNEIHHPSPLLVNSSNAIVSSFPPSFTELLTNCSKYPQHEISKQLEEADHTLGSGESATHLSPQNVTEQLLEADIKNEIARYMSDASFQDLLFKVEKVVHELGGDLSL